MTFSRSFLLQLKTNIEPIVCGQMGFGSVAMPGVSRRVVGALNLFYCGTLVIMSETKNMVEIERIQTGVRMEKRMIKVLKAVAELKDMSLGDLLEGIVLHAFEGKSAFSAQTLKEIDQFKIIYGLTLRATDSHQLKERR
jgi:hypothetical protein